MDMKRNNHWRADLSAPAGGVSAPVSFPRRFGTAAAKVLPGASGTAEIQYTMDRADLVAADPDSANWETWDPGAVAVDTTRALMAIVSAVRLVAYSQPATAQIVMSFDY